MGLEALGVEAKITPEGFKPFRWFKTFKSFFGPDELTV
jgi:hypothetical protein